MNTSNTKNKLKKYKTWNDFFNDISEKSHIVARRKFLYSNQYKEMTFEEKVKFSKNKIKSFFNEMSKEGLTPTISFSGGKDSVVLKSLIEKTIKNKKLPIITSAEIFHPDTIKFILDSRQEYVNGGGMNPLFTIKKL